MYLSIIIPAYNEEKRLVKTLMEIDDYARNQQFQSEIIVIDDGSTDMTAEIVIGMKSKIKNLYLIKNITNRGKGFSVKGGLLYAKGQYRLFMDADNSTSIKEIEKFLPYLDAYDIIIGSRHTKGSIITEAQPLYRIVLGKCYSLLVGIIVGLWEIKDTQCGFKLLSAKVVNDVVKRCRINGWSFDCEMLMIAKKLGYRIRGVAISWSNQGESKVQFPGNVKAILDLFKIRWNFITKKYNKS